MPMPRRTWRTSQRRRSLSSGRHGERDDVVADVHEAGEAEVAGPVAADQVRAEALDERRPCSGLQPGPGSAGDDRVVVREHLRIAAELDHDQRPAGSQQPAEPAERRDGIGDVMHDHRRPHQVGGTQLGQLVIEIGLDAVDATRQPRVESSGSNSSEELARRVDARDVGGREPLREGAGDDPRPTAGIDDVGDGRGVDT